MPAASSMTSRRSSGRALRMASSLTLPDDHVLRAADAGVGQELGHVEQPARLAVDGVLASPSRNRLRVILTSGTSTGSTRPSCRG